MTPSTHKHLKWKTRSFPQWCLQPPSWFSSVRTWFFPSGFPCSICLSFPEPELSPSWPEGCRACYRYTTWLQHLSRQSLPPSPSSSPDPHPPSSPQVTVPRLVLVSSLFGWSFPGLILCQRMRRYLVTHVRSTYLVRSSHSPSLGSCVFVLALPSGSRPFLGTLPQCSSHPFWVRSEFIGSEDACFNTRVFPSLRMICFALFHSFDCYRSFSYTLHLTWCCVYYVNSQ